MNKKRLVIASGLVASLVAGSVLGGCGSTTPGIGVDELTKDPQAVVCLADVETDEDVVNTFSYELFSKNLDKTNPVMSPVSAYLAMSMVGIGAEGKTGEEFQSVLGEGMTLVSDELMQKLPVDKENMVVNIANSAWVDEELAADEVWTATVAEYFKSEIYQTELAGTKTMGVINGWVEDKTEGLIDAILSEPLTDDARLAVINAIYFNGKWETPFTAESTKQEPFIKGDGSKVTVDMMNGFFEYFPYYKNDTMEGVALPYLEDSYVFLAMKPTAGQTVRELYEGLTPKMLEEMLEGQEETLMNLKLPKFRVEYSKELNEDLADMGLSTAFSPAKANFSGLGTSVDGNPLFIDKVLQKAIIIVDEKGTEAAAVTVATVDCGSAMPVDEPIEVYFDEPFLYMIYDTDTEVPLFMGILDDPALD